MRDSEKRALHIVCPRCHAPIAEWCTTTTGKKTGIHRARITATQTVKP